jgi:hypothetical protein
MTTRRDEGVRAGAQRAVTVMATLAALAVASPARAADKQIRPFIGATFAGNTSFVNPDRVSGQRNLIYGVSVASLGEIFGVDVDLADAPGFFEGGDQLIISSRVTTLTGNIVIAAPRRWTEYVLRPYLVGGGGLMRVHAEDYFNVFPVNRVFPAFDVGGGVLMFMTNTLGASFEVRRFQNFYRQSNDPGLTFVGEERVSFWRAGISLAIRY